MNPVLVVVISVAVIVVAAIVIIFTLKFLKGRLTLTLDRPGCNGGEKLAGRVVLELKKPVEANRLFVALIGTEERRTQQGNQTKTHFQEIFRTEVNLDSAQSMPAGYRQTYLFEIVAPKDFSGGETAATLAKGLKLGAELLTGTSHRVLWKVEARLDAKGVDLTDSKSVTINLMFV